MRKGVGEDWINYRERYHEALHRLYELNPQNIIIADRGFTDCAYNSDAQMREEFRRLVACYGDVYIMYFYPGELSEEHDADGRQVLYERDTRDATKLDRVLDEYEALLSMFPYKHVNTERLDVEAATEITKQQILQWHNNGDHDPDV